MWASLIPPLFQFNSFRSLCSCIGSGDSILWVQLMTYLGACESVKKGFWYRTFVVFIHLIIPKGEKEKLEGVSLLQAPRWKIIIIRSTTPTSEPIQELLDPQSTNWDLWPLLNSALVNQCSDLPAVTEQLCLTAASSAAPAPASLCH